MSAATDEFKCLENPYMIKSLENLTGIYSAYCHNHFSFDLQNDGLSVHHVKKKDHLHTDFFYQYAVNFNAGFTHLHIYFLINDCKLKVGVLAAF